METGLVKVVCPECGYRNYLEEWDDYSCFKCGCDLEDALRQAAKKQKF